MGAAKTGGALWCQLISTSVVVPAQAGDPGAKGTSLALDSRFRGNDDQKKLSVMRSAAAQPSVPGMLQSARSVAVCGLVARIMYSRAVRRRKEWRPTVM
jgi:hypothetical protein